MAALPRVLPRPDMNGIVLIGDALGGALKAMDDGDQDTAVDALTFVSAEYGPAGLLWLTMAAANRAIEAFQGLMEASIDQNVTADERARVALVNEMLHLVYNHETQRAWEMWRVLSEDECGALAVDVLTLAVKVIAGAPYTQNSQPSTGEG